MHGPMPVLFASSNKAYDLEDVEEDLDDVDVDVERRDHVHVWVELP